MLTVQQIHDALTAPPTPMQRGRLMAHLQQERRRDGNTTHRQLLEALIAQPMPRQPTYRHPAKARRPEPLAPREKHQTLTDSDRAWLQNLPTPERITYRDAAELARFARQVEKGSPDARLVEQKWAPVRARHDQAAARDALTVARDQWPALPRSIAVDALNEAVAASTSELTDDEGRSRADRLYDEASARRQARHDDLTRVAQRNLDDVEADIRDAAALDPSEAA